MRRGVRTAQPLHRSAVALDDLSVSSSTDDDTDETTHAEMTPEDWAEAKELLAKFDAERGLR